jgi:hypothetical protein
MGHCKTCGKNSDSDYCFQHKPRKPLSTGKGLNRGKMNDTSYSKAPGKVNERVTIQRNFFLSIWKKRPHKSEVSGQYLGQEALSTYFHHILPKSKYPEACLDEENIILLSLSEHEQVEMDIYRYEEVNKRREQLKIKYNL